MIYPETNSLSRHLPDQLAHLPLYGKPSVIKNLKAVDPETSNAIDHWNQFAFTAQIIQAKSK